MRLHANPSRDYSCYNDQRNGQRNDDGDHNGRRVIADVPQLDEKTGKEEYESNEQDNWETCHDLWYLPCLQRVEASLADSNGIAGGDRHILLIFSDPLLSQDAYRRDRQCEGEADEVEDIDLDVGCGCSEAFHHGHACYGCGRVGQLLGDSKKEDVCGICRTLGERLEGFDAECCDCSGEQTSLCELRQRRFEREAK